MQFFKTNRGLIAYYLLSWITFGIYPLYFIHRVHVELNEVCKEDGKKTRGLFLFIVFGIITLGIYPICWWCFTANRMNDLMTRNNMKPRIGAVSFLCWNIFGSLLFGLGPIIAMYKYIHSLNDVNEIHNQQIRAKLTEEQNAKAAAAAAAAAQVAIQAALAQQAAAQQAAAAAAQPVVETVATAEKSENN